MHGGHFDTLEEAVLHYGEVVEFRNSATAKTCFKTSS
jgi:cytochrome c peroxidase